MSIKSELILEGSYLYYSKGMNFSEENFKLVQNLEGQSYTFTAEILSRIESGEFLKVLVRYEMTRQFLPYFVRIERSIGNRYAQEIYRLDNANLELNYTFQNSTTSQDFKRPISAKHYLTSPAFCTSTIFTLSKRFDTTGRTPIILISSDNEWEYQGPPTEKIIFGEYKTSDVEDFKINNTHLSVTHLNLFDLDTTHMNAAKPVEIFISKHFAVPYKMVHEDQEIVVKNLNRVN